MRITIIEGHPDPSAERLNRALADRYVERAEALGHEIRRITVAKLHFPIMRTSKDFYESAPSEEIAAAQRDIAWAQHLVLMFPLWMSDMPALLKAFLEQTFRPDFALDRSRKGRPPRHVLKGRSVRIVVTMGMPAAFYRLVMGAYMLKMLRRLFTVTAGIGPVRDTVIGGVMNPSSCSSRTWFETIDRAVDEDVLRRPRRLAIAVRTAAIAGGAATAGYLAYVLTSWSRYGLAKPSKKQDELLDRFMPNYEVALRHATVVHAPANVTFSAINVSDFERSPIVRLLFLTREIMLRAKPHERAPEGLPLAKLLSLGWSVLAIDPGKAIVLGTVTRPWDRNPRFRSVHPDEFAAFSEPGYAKILLSLRVGGVSSEHCEMRSETRVQTTDPIGRARFRRYWAFLSPGMDIIRRVILAQVKSQAESAWEASRAALV